MNYEFPIDIKLDEVREIIKDSEDFFEADRDDHIIFNYQTCFTNTFPEVTNRETAILRELRGLIFSPEGNVISRPLHKFFNMGEKPENRQEVVDWSKPYFSLNKVDGSMVRPVIISDELFWCSKMGKTFISDDVGNWMNLPENIDKKLNLETLAYSMLNDKTPIFEWTSPENRIVLFYKETDIHLLAIRDNITGEYMSRDEIEDISKVLDITLTPKLDGFTGFTDINCKEYDKMEGIVLTFDDGHMIKVKTDWYIHLHRVKSQFSVERNLVRIILSGDLDDLLSTLDGDIKDMVILYEQNLQKFLSSLTIMLEIIRNKIKNGIIKDKKDFALNFKPNLPLIISQIIFSTWNKQIETNKKLIIEKIQNNLTSGRRFDDLKKDLSWEDHCEWKFNSQDK